jgi:hypothetical protein
MQVRSYGGRQCLGVACLRGKFGDGLVDARKCEVDSVAQNLSDKIGFRGEVEVETSQCQVGPGRHLTKAGPIETARCELARCRGQDALARPDRLGV